MTLVESQLYDLPLFQLVLIRVSLAYQALSQTERLEGEQRPQIYLLFPLKVKSHNALV